MDYDAETIESQESIRSVVPIEAYNTSFVKYLYYFLEICKSLFGLYCLFFLQVKFSNKALNFYLYIFTFNFLACFFLGFFLVLLIKPCFSQIKLGFGIFVFLSLLLICYFICIFYSFYSLSVLRKENTSMANFDLMLIFLVFNLVISLVLLIPFFLFCCCTRTGVSNKQHNFLDDETIIKATKEVKQVFRN